VRPDQQVLEGLQVPQVQQVLPVQRGRRGLSVLLEVRVPPEVLEEQRVHVVRRDMLDLQDLLVPQAHKTMA
jgi:hypothetical protein